MYIRMKVTAQNIESLLHGEALSNWRRETWAARTPFLEAYDEVFTEDAWIEQQCRGKNGCGLWHLFK